MLINPSRGKSSAYWGEVESARPAATAHDEAVASFYSISSRVANSVCREAQAVIAAIRTACAASAR